MRWPRAGDLFGPAMAAAAAAMEQEAEATCLQRFELYESESVSLPMHWFLPVFLAPIAVCVAREGFRPSDRIVGESREQAFEFSGREFYLLMTTRIAIFHRSIKVFWNQFGIKPRQTEFLRKHANFSICTLTGCIIHWASNTFF